jgi:hypothetical protein
MDTAYNVVGVPSINSITSREAVTFYHLRFAVDLIILKLKITKSLGAGISVILSLLLSLPFKGTLRITKPASIISSFLPIED